MCEPFRNFRKTSFSAKILFVKISAVIIAYNESRNIGEAIRSVDWADEILVVDSGSMDDTREIAESLGARVIDHPWIGFAEQKQFAIQNAENDRIISLDADERVTTELKNEILSLTGAGNLKDGYSIPRQTFYRGQKIRYGGWYPDRQLRFFDRRAGEWTPRAIHESFKLHKGATLGELSGHLLHYTVDSIEQHNRSIAERYAPLGAKQMLTDHKSTSFLNAFLSALGTFIRTYILKAGVLDGRNGLLIAYFAAHNTLMKHLIFLENRSVGRKTE